MCATKSVDRGMERRESRSGRERERASEGGEQRRESARRERVERNTVRNNKHQDLFFSEFHNR